jgi:hypothetical protein
MDFDHEQSLGLKNEMSCLTILKINAYYSKGTKKQKMILDLSWGFRIFPDPQVKTSLFVCYTKVNFQPHPGFFIQHKAQIASNSFRKYSSVFTCCCWPEVEVKFKLVFVLKKSSIT